MAQAPRNGAIPDYVEVLAGQDGSATRALKTDANGELQVDVLTMPTTTPPTGASATQVQGAAAEGAGPTGNPVYAAGLGNDNVARAIPVRVDTAFRSLPAATVNKSNNTPAVGLSSAWGDSIDQDSLPAVVPFFLGTSTGLRRVRGVETSKPGQATALADGSTADVWTPASGKKFRLLGLAVGASAAGRYALVEGAGNALVLPLRLPANQSVCLDIQANGILAAAANNVLKLRNNSGGAADLDWCLWGMEE